MTPMLLGIHQLEELDTALCAKERKADFEAINMHGVPLNKTEKGHLTVSLNAWPNKGASETAPSITTDEIDIWAAEVQEIDEGVPRRKQRKNIETWEQELQDKLDQCQQVVETLKADPEEKRPIRCELYAGGMAAASEARQRWRPTARPRGILVGATNWTS
eukprot:2628744-Pyramimonas_sp.AAC.1